MNVESIHSDNLIPLSQLMLALWPEENKAELLAHCQLILTDPHQTCYLLKSEMRYIAFIQLALRSEYVEGATHSPVAYVEGIYVEPAFQQQGLGRQLIQLAERWAKTQGSKELASDVELSNTQSLIFHQQMDFREVNRVVCFIKSL